MALPATASVYRLGQDPELRFTPYGVAVGTVRAIASSRKKQDNGEWVDDKKSWVTLTFFNRLAENVVESLHQGDEVVAIGRLEVQEWEDKDGNKRITPAILVDSIGPSLAFATAKVVKAERAGGQSSERSRTSRSTGPQQDDPWATPAPSDDPPF